MRTFLFAMLAVYAIAGCSQQSESCSPAQATALLRLSFEDNEGKHVLREVRLTQEQLKQGDYAKDLVDVIKNRSGTARMESIVTSCNVLTNKEHGYRPEIVKHEYRSEIVSPIVNGQVNGLQESFAGGRKFRELSFREGVRDGYERQYWLPTSQLSLCGNWKAGKKDGNWAAFYVNEKLGFRWQMKNGVMQGRAIAWSPEGKKVAEGLFRAGKPFEGTFVAFNGTSFGGPWRFERRVLVPNPSYVSMPAGTYKLITYKRGNKTAERPLEIPFASSELEAWQNFDTEAKANDGILPNKGLEADAQILRAAQACR